MQSSKPSRALWGESWRWSRGCGTRRRTAPRAVEGPRVFPGSPPPLLRPWRVQACSPWDRRPGRGRTLARVLSRCWWTVPAAPRWPGDSQPCPRPFRPRPHSPAAPQCPGRQRAQGGRGRPAINMEEMVVSSGGVDCPSPSMPTGPAPNFMAESPRPRGHGSPPWPLFQQGPQPSPTSPPGWGGPLCCP